MAFKQFKLDDLTIVTVYKTRNSKNLKLSIGSTGKVRVSIPLWAPYISGVNFAVSRHQWIEEQSKKVVILSDGQSIGKAHHLKFRSANISTAKSRIKNSEILVQFPNHLNQSDISVQKVASNVCIKALREQAERLLPQRLRILAKSHGFEVESISIKKLKSRWGSCDSQKNIVLNLFLMQLPWELIDYVLLHELVHTKVLRHGSDFWDALELELPYSKHLRKQIHTFQPVLNGLQHSVVT